MAAIVAETAAGKIQGTLIEGVQAFKSVPYGASTAGANRFLPPKGPESLAGVRDATAYTSRAPQAGLRAATRPELANFSGATDTAAETEDCLTLNVWTPGPTGKRPVMVWLHGGAFSYGSANSDRQQGSRLCNRGDVVVVTVNHRLNIFAHLHLGEIWGPDYAGSSNAGVLDLVAALEWVRDNISAFGGDPGNVTIFGESGGGGKVSTLMTMPSARGLFHKAIVQSGASVVLGRPERAARLADIVLRQLGLGRGDLGRLQNLPAAALLAAVGPATKELGPAERPLFDRYAFGPVVDGDVLPRDPFAPDASPVSADIPLLIGDMKSEMTSFYATIDPIWHRTLSEAQARDRLIAIAGRHTDTVIETYRRLYPRDNPAQRLIAATTDSNFRVRSLAVAQRKAAQGKAPVWMYSFEWETPLFEGRLGAPHALDVPFCFDTIDLTNATDLSPGAKKVAATMSSTWIAFARSGNPNNETIRHWPAYNAAEWPTLVLDVQPSVQNDLRGEARRLWQDITGTTI
jgi:para-nitrobenzyl esterase